ncbi:MAG TPA: histidine kinase dimerization/phosphoacceptor domain -containing protein [Alphaproteobacteria bacterium]|nr:histidine kinase dimerization/phosphoacceptor domain -containing protein [Alphaproteobacteria bacterium]
MEPPVIDPSAAAARIETTERALKLRLRQQEILSELGVVALQGPPFPELIEKTVRLTAEGLEAEFCKVLEYQPADQNFLVRAGVGWDEGIIGKATVGADTRSPAGFAFKTGRPVISNQLGAEDRFRTPELLVQHGIHRAMNVILQGDQTPYGVLEVDSRSKGEFSEHDLAFLQGAANILGMAIERQRMECNLKTALDRQQLLLKELNHRVKNSFQLVTSLLRLQAGSTKDSNVRRLLDDASSRISAIARAHERLYLTDSVDVIDIGAYLSAVCLDLDEVAAQCQIHVDAPAGIEMAVDRAIPLVLLVAELITNAAKHAYAGSGANPIWVTLSGSDANQVIVSVRDEGVGLPADFELKEQKSLGMRIISAFAQQLGAEIDAYGRRPGAEFIVKVPIFSGG